MKAMEIKIQYKIFLESQMSECSTKAMCIQVYDVIVSASVHSFA